MGLPLGAMAYEKVAPASAGFSSRLPHSPAKAFSEYTHYPGIPVNAVCPYSALYAHTGVYLIAV